MSSTSSYSLEPIAVVAIAGRFPGAPTLETFWDNLRRGVESISRLTDDELRAAGVDEACLRDPHYVRAAAVLPNAESFDAAFFGYLPREAAMLDPQHRVFLESVWEVLEAAGYDPDRYSGTIGVFGGVATNSYLVNHLCQSPDFRAERATFDTMLASDKDYVTTRVAYELNLRGPAVTVQTACSTSLVAVHLACQHLWSFQCDIAIAGAAAVRCPQTAGYVHKDGMILSPDGHTRTFDGTGRGTVMGSGVGVVLLKRLSDAVNDRDQILALVRSSAVNNDGGCKAGYTAPSVQGQAAVIAMAHQLAEIEADTISYVEAHGTATAVGDPIEVAALAQAFRATTAATRFCAIGSVKTNIGHADAAAGMAGLIKTVLALTHRELPPSLHFAQPNPAIDFERSPFYVNTALVPWESGTRPRRAGVSSFGIGGTNAHVVLEEAPPSQAASPGRRWQLLVLSAKTVTALETATTNVKAFLAGHPGIDIADVAWTLQVGRKPFPHRRAVVVEDAADAVEALAKQSPARVIDGTAPSARRTTVFLFPGQGAQRVNMARALFDGEPVFRTAFTSCAECLSQESGVDLTTVVYPCDPTAPGQPSTAIDETRLTQPCLFAVEYALVQLLQSWGIHPDAMIGHSVGEYVAACVAGVMSLEDALAVIAARGRLMQLQPPGAMLAVPLPEHGLLPYMDGTLSLAALNGPTQSVAAGPFDAVDRLERRLAEAGITTRRVSTSHAFHSSMMAPAADALFDVVAAITLKPPQIPFISSVTGTWISPAQATDPRYWSEHLRRTVRFADGIRTLRDTPERLWLEVGPGQALSALARQQGVAPVLSALPTSDRSTRAHLLGVVGTLWAHGTAIDWAAAADVPRRRVALPTYPFERRRCWVDPPVAERALTEHTCETAPGTAAPPADNGTAAPQSSHVERTLTRVLQDLSGLDAAAIDRAATFVDLGFDSLLLTQAALAFRKACGVPITFRQLLEETPSVAALAAFVEAHGGVAKPAPATAVPAADNAQPAEGPSFALSRSGRPRDDSALTTRQQKHLLALTARYTRRTAGSKRLTQQYRRYHADPRTAAGFDPRWKELVYPIVVARSAGCRLWDIDGNEYIDLLNGFGPNFLGHSHPVVTEALREQLDRGIELGPQTPLAGEVAQLVCELTGMERVSFVNTGSEAVQAALRVARTVTGRDKIVLFAGDYHGNFDEVLVRAAGAAGRTTVPSAPGIPSRSVGNVLVLEYGSSDALDVIRANASEIAAVLVEPVQSRRPEFQPQAFVHELRRVTREAGALLIFDEVITGFRAGPGGAQAFYGIQADLATYGKVAGGGMPIGMVAGKAEFMDTFDGGLWQYGDDSAPAKGVTFFAGTFIRHPLAMAAARATLTYLKQQGPELWRRLDERAARLAGGLDRFAVERQLPFRVPSFCSLFYLRVEPERPLANLLFYHLRDRGVYLQEGFPSYLTLAHSDADVDRVIELCKDSVAELEAAECFAPSRRHVPAPPAPLAPAAPVLHDRADSVEFPLTEAQKEIWLATRLGPLASAAYNESCVLHLRGRLHVDALRRALTDVVARHEAFRTTVVAANLSQRVVPRPMLDLDGCLADGSPGSAALSGTAALLHRDSVTPFDLERGPLARATLVEVEPQYHLLVFTTHHIICDGWSTTRLLSELGVRYSALVADRGVAAPPPATPFRKLAEWQAAHASSPDGAADERFWLDTLRGDLPILELPTDRPHPPQRSYRGGREELAVDPELVDRLKRMSARHGCTLVTAQLAVFEVLLHRLTGQTDFIVGLPAAEHTVLGTADVVGHGTNLLPLRVAIESSTPFDRHLEAVKRTILNAADHRHSTYGALLRQLRLGRSAGRLPLVEVIFNIDRQDDGLSFRGLEVSLVDNERYAFNFDFGLNCVQTDRTLLLQGDYNADLFEPETIGRWLGHFRTLLAAVVQNPSCKIGALPLLTAAERASLLSEWNLHAGQLS